MGRPCMFTVCLLIICLNLAISSPNYRYYILNQNTYEQVFVPDYCEELLSQRVPNRGDADRTSFLQTLEDREARCLADSIRLNSSEIALVLDNGQVGYMGAAALRYTVKDFEGLRAVIESLDYQSSIWSSDLINLLMLQVADDLTQEWTDPNYSSGQQRPLDLFSRPARDLKLMKNFMQGFNINMVTRLAGISKTNQDRFFVQMNNAGLSWNKYKAEVKSGLWNIFSTMMTTDESKPFLWSDVAIDIGADMFDTRLTPPAVFDRFGALQLYRLLVTDALKGVGEAGLVRIIGKMVEEEKGELRKDADFFRKLGGYIGYVRYDLLPLYFDWYLMTSTTYLQNLMITNQKHASLFDVILRRLQIDSDNTRDKQIYLSCYMNLAEVEKTFDLQFVQHNIHKFPHGCFLRAPAHRLVAKYLESRPNILRSLTLEDLKRTKGFFWAFSSAVIAKLRYSSVSDFWALPSSKIVDVTPVQTYILMQKIIQSNQPITIVDSKMLVFLPYSSLPGNRGDYKLIKQSMPRWIKLSLLEDAGQVDRVEGLTGVQVRLLREAASCLPWSSLCAVRNEEVISVIHSIQESSSREEALQYSRVNVHMMQKLTGSRLQRGLDPLSDFEISAISSLVIRDFPIDELPRENRQRCKEIIRRIGASEDLGTTIPAFKRKQIVAHYSWYCRDEWSLYSEMSYEDLQTLGALSCDLDPYVLSRVHKSVLARNLFQFRSCCLSPGAVEALRGVLGHYLKTWDPYWFSDLGTAACDLVQPNDKFPSTMSDTLITQILYEDSPCKNTNDWMNGFKIEDKRNLSTNKILQIQRSHCGQKLLQELDNRGHQALKGTCYKAHDSPPQFDCAQIMSIGKGIQYAETQLTKIDSCTLDRCLSYFGTIEELPRDTAQRLLGAALRLRGVNESSQISRDLVRELGHLLVHLPTDRLKDFQILPITPINQKAPNRFDAVDAIFALSNLSWSMEQREILFEKSAKTLSQTELVQTGGFVISRQWYEDPLSWTALGDLSCSSPALAYVRSMSEDAFVRSINSFSKLAHLHCAESGMFDAIWERATVSHQLGNSFQRWKPHVFSFLGNIVSGIKRHEIQLLNEDNIFEIKPDALKFMHLDSLKTVLADSAISIGRLTVPQLKVILLNRHAELDPQELLTVLKLLANDENLNLLQDTIVTSQFISGNTNDNEFNQKLSEKPGNNKKIPEITNADLLPTTGEPFSGRYIIIYSQSRQFFPSTTILFVSFLFIIKFLY